MTGFSEQIERYYDALANTYDDYYDDEISKAEDFLIGKLISDLINPYDNVLDCGCGTGLAKTLLSGVPCRYTGVDISNNMLEIAKCKHPNENFIHGDIANMPYLESDSFDSVISLNGAFSHVLNYNDAINEFMRVIKPGGNLFIMVYSRFSFKRILNGSFIKTKGAYNIRNSSKNKKLTSPAHFWSVNKLRRAFSPFQNVNVRGLNLMVDVLNKHYEFHEAVSRLEREMTYPLFMQNFSHALVLKATK